MLEQRLHQRVLIWSWPAPRGKWEREGALGTLSGDAAVCEGAASWKSIPSLLGFARWGSNIPFYRQKEALTYLQTREILNFKPRSYFLFKIQIERDCC